MGKLAVSMTFSMVFSLMTWGTSFAQNQAQDLDNWTQFTGSPNHDNFRPLENTIRNPVILWFLPEANGVPAVYEGKAYVPGLSLSLVDLKSGRVIHSVPAAAKSGSAEPAEEKDSEDWYEVPAKDERERYRRRERGGPQLAFSGTPVVVGERVVAVKIPNSILAFSLDLKKKLWETKIGEGYYGHFPPACDGDVIVLGGHCAMGISPQDGKILWTFKPDNYENAVSMSPALWQGKVYFGNRSGEIFCLDAKTGKEIWKKKYHCEFGWSCPTVVDGRIFLADRGNRGETLRRGEEDDPPTDEDDPNVSRGGAVNAFDANTGKRIWLTKFGATGCSTPGIGPGVVFTGTGGTVRVYDQKTGAVDRSKVFRCYTSNPFGSPTIVGDAMIFGSLGGRLHVYDYKSRKLRWTFSVEGVMRGAQVHGFVPLGCGILLVKTTVGLYALGQNPEAPECEEGFNLTPEGGYREIEGTIVKISDYASSLSRFVLKTEEGVTVNLAVEGVFLKYWLRESWKGACKVRVKYTKDEVGGRMLNRIVKVSPIKR